MNVKRSAGATAGVEYGEKSPARTVGQLAPDLQLLYYCSSTSTQTTMFTIDASDPTPLYAKLERAIRAAVADGRLQAGDQLPTVRQLAVDLSINANTVARVYAALEHAGVVETRRGVGTFVVGPVRPAGTSASREKELHAIEDRFLAESAALGFDIHQVIEHLRNRIQRKKR